MSRDLDVMVEVSASDDAREVAGAAFIRACEHARISVREVRSGDRSLKGAFVHATAWGPGTMAVLSVTTDGDEPHEPLFQSIDNEAVFEAVIATPVPSHVQGVLTEVFGVWLRDLAERIPE